MARVPGLNPEVRPLDDARALGSLVRAIRRVRPDILHTHTAKAGMLGRTAALLSGVPRPIIVHTYHGHVLTGYFGPARNTAYRETERRLGRISDALIGVSSATVDDLVALGVAPREKFHTIPIGLDLDAFVEATPRDGADFRRDVGMQPGEALLTFVGRLARIKRVDHLLHAFACARRLGAAARLAIVGDGPLRSNLEDLSRRLGIHERVHFAGYRADMVSVAAAADLAVLSSDNEGTPVSLIEAGAACTASAAFSVGGVRDVVHADTGILVPASDVSALGRAIARLANDPGERTSMGQEARKHVSRCFSADRLVADIEDLYDALAVRRARWTYTR